MSADPSPVLVLRVNHQLRYAYPSPVVLGPQRLQLRPRLSPMQHLRSYHLVIHPRPSRHYAQVDAEGNTVQWVYFEEASAHFDLLLQLEAESRPFNPFDFIIYPFSATRLPMAYPYPLDDLLRPYRDIGTVAPAVAEWSAELMAQAGGEVVSFLVLLSTQLRARTTYYPREKGPPQDPAQTFALGRGACRDIACLMMAACRHAGLAARFVSGYAFPEEADFSHELHAWVEVYLPGAGWRGFDPTLGAAVTERHLALAASAYPRQAAPLSGAFWGRGEASLETAVQLQWSTL